MRISFFDFHSVSCGAVRCGAVRCGAVKPVEPAPHRTRTIANYLVLKLKTLRAFHGFNLCQNRTVRCGSVRRGFHISESYGAVLFGKTAPTVPQNRTAR